ncbi:MAG: sigma-54-dependent Fis family transcriptional regulator [Alphaproteobacteria bacterium]|nr:sigma-54-dependent Fis family transcriptional regulator [Alphaproteobacteria bacterium]
MALEILIVDDEDDIRQQIAGILEDEGYETRQAINSAETFAAINARTPSLIILDVWLRDSEHDGLQMLEIIRRENEDQQVVMISGHGTFDMAVSATKMGAYDFISKPFKTDVLLHTVSRALNERRLRREHSDLKRRVGDEIGDLVGKSTSISNLRQNIEKLAHTDSRILISGPTGSGKGVTARILHKKSARNDGPFVVMNCASLKPEDFEGTLFGREPVNGAARKVGVLEEAHRGVLLLDEVADMPLETQGKMARVLQNQIFERLDGENRVEVNVRVLATTSRDLSIEIEKGQFREDLFYRLNVVPLEIPPLSARRDDIPLLAEHFMERISRAKGRLPRVIGDDAMVALQGHTWPGNVWELINVVERLTLFAPGKIEDIIHAQAVIDAIGDNSDDSSEDGAMFDMLDQPLREARESFERKYLLFHLTRLGGNISRTAEFVEMDRAALHRKLKLLGVRNVVRD